MSSHPSQDDFFTDPHIIQQCVNLIRETVLPALSKKQLFVIDSSAGNNEFCRQLRSAHYYSTDPFVNLYSNVYGKVDNQDWLNVRQSDIKYPKSQAELAVGFNPPYGKRHQLIHAFVQHAIDEFHPDWMFWLIPEFYKFKHNDKYELYQTLKVPEGSFYRPLTGHIQGGVLCEFRIYRKRDKPLAIEPFDEEKVEKPNNVQVVRLKSVADGKTDLSQVSHNQIFMVRSWGRGAGRKFAEPQSNGQVFHYKDMESKPNQIDESVNDMIQRNQSKVFIVFIFDKPMDRQRFRQQWLQCWKRMEPHSFDPRNSVQMNVYMKRHCYPILNEIIGS